MSPTTSTHAHRAAIDLRSDTVTLPTRQTTFEASARAPLGDDVYGEAPTAAALERASADRRGDEPGVFFPMGTMANLCAILTHAPRGTRAIAGDGSHVVAAMCAVALDGGAARLAEDHEDHEDARTLAAALASFVLGMLVLGRTLRWR